MSHEKRTFSKLPCLSLVPFDLWADLTDRGPRVPALGRAEAVVIWQLLG